MFFIPGKLLLQRQVNRISIGYFFKLTESVGYQFFEKMGKENASVFV